MSKEELLYEKLCCGCPNEKKCHDNCDYCDEFLNKLNENTPTEALETIKQLHSKMATKIGYTQDEFYKIANSINVIEEALEDYRKTKLLLNACEIANYNFKVEIKELNDVLEAIKSTKGLIEKEDFCKHKGRYFFFANEIDKKTYVLLRKALL